jgi:hemolysin-activating ACP:hemolysin acyltransferase
MVRKPVPGQHRKITPEHLLVNATVNSVVTSKQQRAPQYLEKLKQNKTIFSHNQNLNFEKDFVEVVNLGLLSELHCNYSYMDCVINFAFPLFKNQYVLYRDNNRTLGYLSWAWFSSETEQDFYNSQKILTDPDIFCSGPQGWIIDVIAPFGHAKATVKHASTVARARGIDAGKFKFQRNYVNKTSRRNFCNYQ